MEEENLEDINIDEKDSIYSVTKLLFFICMIFTVGAFRLVMTAPELIKYFGQYIMILIPIIIFMNARKWTIKETFRFNKIDIGDIILLIAMTISIQPFLSLMLMLSNELFGDGMSLLFQESFKTPFLITVFTLAITPAICEEFLMRGVILNGSRGLSMTKAALLNGLLFGLFHMNLNQFSYTFFMGILLAYVVLATNSIFSGMLIHFLNNLWAIIAEYSSDLGAVKLENAITENIFSKNGIMFATASAIITIVLLKILIKKNKDKIYVPDANKQNTRIFKWPFWSILILFILNSLLIIISLKLI